MIIKIKNAKLIRFILTIGLIIGSTSCEEALNEEVFSFLAKENFYKNADDAESAIYGIYSGLTNDNVYGRWFYDILHLADDQSTIHRNETFIQMDDFNFSADHPYIESFWTGLYTVINRSNVCIERIPNIEMDENLKNSMVAEARCIRANMYFILVRLWGSVPFSINEVGDEESANSSMGTIDEIYNIIIEDLEFAEENLPSTRGEDEFGRVTSGAAKALLTDVLLTRGNWNDAAEKAKEIIESGYYSLMDNFESIFTEENEQNEEIIYSIVFDGINKGNWMASFSQNGGSDNAQCFKGAHVWEVDEKSDMWLNWSEEDPRRGFSVSSEYLSLDGTYKDLYTTSAPYPQFGKWNAPNEISHKNCPLNPIIYRYADVLLMYAEALSQANNGPNTDAYNAINMVRRRGYKQPIDDLSEFDLPSGLDAQSFRDKVIEERSHEFVVEGKRLFDLMRTDQFPQILIDMGKNVNTGAKLFPIPTAEIDANSSLTAADQNDGY